MDAIVTFFNNIPDLVGDQVYQGLRWGVMFGPLIGWVIWPFFGRNGDRVVSWALGGLLGGALVGGGLQFTAFMAGMRQATAIYDLAANEGTGVAAFMSMVISAGIGAAIGLVLVMAVQELQRAVSGAFYGLLLGLGLAVLASLGWDYIPMALPTAYQPVIVAGLILVVVIFVGANTSSRA